MADDIFSKISAMMADPEIAGKIKEVASSVTSGETGIPADTQSLAKIGSMLGGLDMKNNREAALLMAIKPYLRESRAAKINSAIRAVQIVQVLSSIQKSGSI